MQLSPPYLTQSHKYRNLKPVSELGPENRKMFTFFCICFFSISLSSGHVSAYNMMAIPLILSGKCITVFLDSLDTKKKHFDDISSEKYNLSIFVYEL